MTQTYHNLYQKSILQFRCLIHFNLPSTQRTQWAMPHLLDLFHLLISTSFYFINYRLYYIKYNKRKSKRKDTGRHLNKKLKETLWHYFTKSHSNIILSFRNMFYVLAAFCASLLSYYHPKLKCIKVTLCYMLQT